MHLNKSQREILRLKFNGRCAYCGCDLPKNWHADHFEPVIRFEASYFSEKSGQMRPENNRFENLMPSCPNCNIAKSSMPIEMWRDMLGRNIKAMMASSKFKLLEKHGLVTATPKPIVFYYEIYNQEFDI